jgi:hypothetical protein
MASSSSTSQGVIMTAAPWQTSSIAARRPSTMPKGGDHLHDWLRPWMPRLLSILSAATATGRPVLAYPQNNQLYLLGPR